MLREQLIKKVVGDGAFRWRSQEISRIQGLSFALVVIGGSQMAGLAGSIYMLTGVVMTMHGWRTRRHRKLLNNKIAATPHLNQLNPAAS